MYYSGKCIMKKYIKIILIKKSFKRDLLPQKKNELKDVCKIKLLMRLAKLAWLSPHGLTSKPLVCKEKKNTKFKIKFVFITKAIDG